MASSRSRPRPAWESDTDDDGQPRARRRAGRPSWESDTDDAGDAVADADVASVVHSEGEDVDADFCPGDGDSGDEDIPDVAPRFEVIEPTVAPQVYPTARLTNPSPHFSKRSRCSPTERSIPVLSG